MIINIFDVAIILLIIMSAVNGSKVGALKSLVNFVGTIIVYVLAFMFKSKVGILLCKFCPFFNFDGYPTLNILLYQMIAFVLIAGILFTLFNFIIKVTGLIQRLVDMTIILKLPSSILGFVIGLLEGYIVMFVVIAVLAVPFRNHVVFRESKVADAILNKSPILTSSLGGVVDSLSDVMKVTTTMENNEIDQKNQTNLDIMGAYLEHKVISKKDALDIISMEKFDTIPGIKQYVESYK